MGRGFCRSLLQQARHPSRLSSVIVRYPVPNRLAQALAALKCRRAQSIPVAHTSRATPRPFLSIVSFVIRRGGWSLTTPRRASASTPSRGGNLSFTSRPPAAPKVFKGARDGRCAEHHARRLSPASMRSLVVGSRGSDLARAMALEVLTLLRKQFPERDFRHRVIKTTGDGDRRTSLSALGAKSAGVFTSSLQDALAAGQIDIAMHSLKDLPTEMPPGSTIGAIPLRRDPTDALCGSTLNALPPRARVGTGSPRRRAQLLHARPDVEVVGIRGNVVPRIRHLESSATLTAIVLATAGIDRLGLSSAIAERLPIEEFVPAPGQGATALEARTSDHEVIELLATVDDPEVRVAVAAEREVLRLLDGGCSSPVGVYATASADRLWMVAQLTEVDGSTNIVVHRNSPVDLGVRLAEEVAAAMSANGTSSGLNHEDMDQQSGLT